jgi:3-phosphoshikimate 1-carboxyvinyltransferase
MTMSSASSPASQPNQSARTGPYRTLAADKPLSGHVVIPGDKSISHRALMLGSVAIGTTRISGLLEGDDVLATAAAMRAFGATLDHIGKGEWEVTGLGIGNFSSPAGEVDFGNAGTGCRLTMGLATGSPVTATFIGDASLSKRPMRRVLNPLIDMGLLVEPDQKETLPLTLRGPERPIPISYRLPVASAQVKSAILLAGLTAPGETHIIEPHPTRDHSEHMLELFGADIRSEQAEDGNHVWLRGEKQLSACDITVPGDPSSAAFPLVAALLVDGSEVYLENVMSNPHRDGLFHVLRQMGAEITSTSERRSAGEDVFDLQVRGCHLQAVDVPASIAPSMIDEYPILAIAAAYADGESVFRGLGELRVKESDRLQAIADGLTANGVQARIDGDDLYIQGVKPNESGVRRVDGGGRVATHHDHRIAMSFLILGLLSEKAVEIDDASMIQSSFPEFFDLMHRLGANFESCDA